MSEQTNIVTFTPIFHFDDGGEQEIKETIADAIRHADEAAEDANDAAAAANIATAYTQSVASYITDDIGLEKDITSGVVLTDGKFIVSNTGAESGTSQPNYSYTDYIDITNFDTVRITMPKVTLTSTYMGISFYDSTQTFISGSGQIVQYNQPEGGYNTIEINIPSNAKYFRSSWFSSDGDFSSLYSSFACVLIKKENKPDRNSVMWYEGGIVASTGAVIANSKRIHSEWVQVNSGDGMLSCASGYTFAVFGKGVNGTYLGWFNPRYSIWSTSAINGYTRIDTQWIKANGADQVMICLIGENNITTIDGSNLTWTCDQCVDDIRNINSELNYAIYTEKNLTTAFRAGRYLDLSVNIGETVNSYGITSSYCFQRVQCKKGDRFILTASTEENGPIVWGFLDANNKLLRKAPISSNASNTELCAEQDGYFVANAYVFQTYALTATLLYPVAEELVSKFPDFPAEDGKYILKCAISDNGAQYNTEWSDSVNATGTTVDGYIHATDGEIKTSSSYKRTQLIPIVDGISYYYNGRLAVGTSIAGYDENGIFVADVLAPDVSTSYTDELLTIPNGVKFIIASHLKSGTPALSIIAKGDGIESLHTQTDDLYNRITALSSEQMTDLAMFKRIGVLGDSYSCGGLYGISGISNGARRDVSWPTILGRSENVECVPFAAAGATAKTYLTDSYCLPALLSVKACDLYIIMLGINTETTGTIEDIHDEDPTQNADSFFGNMGRIYTQLVEHAPRAKVIFVKPPMGSDERRAAVGDIANHYSVPCFDTLDDTYYHTYFYTSNKSQGHPVAVTYAGMAQAMKRQITKCMQDNIDYFKTYTGSTVGIQVVDDTAALAVSTANTVLVIHNDANWGNNAPCWYESVSSTYVNIYSIQRINGTYMNPIPDQPALSAQTSQNRIDYALRNTTYLSDIGQDDKYYDLNVDIGDDVSSLPSTKAGYTAAKIECKAGDEFKITAGIASSGGVVDGVVAWGFVEKKTIGITYTLVERGELGVSYSQTMLKAKKDGYLLVNHYTAGDYSLTGWQLFKAADHDSVSDLSSNVENNATYQDGINLMMMNYAALANGWIPYWTENFKTSKVMNIERVGDTLNISGTTIDEFDGTVYTDAVLFNNSTLSPTLTTTPVFNPSSTNGFLLESGSTYKLHADYTDGFRPAGRNAKIYYKITAQTPGAMTNYLEMVNDKNETTFTTYSSSVVETTYAQLAIKIPAEDETSWSQRIHVWLEKV